MFCGVFLGYWRSEPGEKERSGLFFKIDLDAAFVIIYICCAATERQNDTVKGGTYMATKSNYILKVQDAKLADVQKALKDANITVVSIMEIHKEEA